MPNRTIVGLGTALSFPGTETAYALLKNGAILSALANSSISMWINTSALGNTNGSALYSERAPSGNDIWKLRIANGSSHLSFLRRDDAGNFDNGVAFTSATVSDGLWHNIVLTKAGTAVNIYVDNVLSGSATLTSTDTLTSGTITSQLGKDDSQTLQSYTGLMDEVRLYNVALGTTDIATLFAKGDVQTGLIDWYKFDEGSGTTLVDSKGSNTGSIQGSVSYVPGIISNGQSRTIASVRAISPARRRADTGGFNPAPVPRGIAISGAEFEDPATQPTYTYFQGKGFNFARVAFKWEDVQQFLNGSLTTSTLDTQIGYAASAGIPVVLDMHNFGRRTIQPVSGGFTDDFSNAAGQTTFTVPYGDQNSATGEFTFRDFGRGQAGTLLNPVSPATGYVFSISVKCTQTGSSSDNMELSVFRVDDNNQYKFDWNQNTGNWTLAKIISGSTTTVASGNLTFTANTYFAVVMDVGQGTAGKINMTIGGTPLYTTNSVSIDAALTGGYVMVAPEGLHITTKQVTLNIAGDTSSGDTSSHSVGDGTLTNAHFANFWSQMATKYKNNSTVYGFDLMNEPYSMTVPTTPSNYNTTSTVTNMYQAAINAVRLIDNTKWLYVQFDNFAGAQNFTTQYGSNPTPWYIDSANRLVYDFHYYFDDDHSGTYPIAFKASNQTAIATDVTPVMAWCATHKLNGILGEYGVPNIGAWQVCLTTVLDLCNEYGIWTHHWAGGDAYNSPTTIQPTFSPTVDKLQMAIVGASQYLGTLK